MGVSLLPPPEILKFEFIIWYEKPDNKFEEKKNCVKNLRLDAS